MLGDMQENEAEKAKEKARPAIIAVGAPGLAKV